ncbi:uncharacterized protein [Fopius arisanus]|uniref:Uncharacterized protein n=1 Tax=Fopius arisanus TaxID=64838 RepID=A0A9R1TS44_9HYME|nr:PREDICTED: uncharacterized protein LOC105263028 [Fopius arisanus]
MEYTSCIRIRGVPILPPLMTEELRSEMTYYKQLALSLEEKLSRQRLTPENSPETLKTSSTPRISRKSSKTWSKTEETLSDDETTLTKSTDLNKYLVHHSDTSETSSEPSKPRIPTSLDIIPITLESLKKSKSSSSIQNIQEPRKLVRQGSYTLDTPSPMLLAHIELNRPPYVPTASRNLQESPKKRQWGVSAPRNEWKCQDEAENPCDTSGTPRRVNGSLESIHSQFSSTAKTFRLLERSKSSNEVKTRNFDDKNRNSNERNRSLTRRQSNPDKNFSNSSGNRNFECQNQSISSHNRNLDKENENLRKSSNSEKIQNLNHIDKNQNSGTNTSQIIEKNFEATNRNLSEQNRNFDRKNRNVESKEFCFGDKKLGGSLGDLLNGSSEMQSQEPDERMTKSLDTTDFEAGTSERLLGVFREIQRTHDRQMADLIERQQREQAFMQQAFEKQQLMLLEQIDRSFPGISIMELVKRVEGERKWRNEDFSSSFDSDGSVSINMGESGLEVSPESKIKAVSRQLFPLEAQIQRMPLINGRHYDQRHVQAATVINAYARGFLVRRMMKTEQIIALKNTYREALHCMLKLTIDAPLELPELNFHKRLQLQCDAASMNIVELFSQSSSKRMEIIGHDRQIKKARMERPSSARSSMSFATQRTLARKKLKELGIFQLPETHSTSRSRCQTWTSNNRDKKSPGIVYRGIKRSTSAGAVRKPWR